jgi:hypothetical protein
MVDLVVVQLVVKEKEVREEDIQVEEQCLLVRLQVIMVLVAVVEAIRYLQ